MARTGNASRSLQEMRYQEVNAPEMMRRYRIAEAGTVSSPTQHEKEQQHRSEIHRNVDIRRATTVKQRHTNTRSKARTASNLQATVPGISKEGCMSLDITSRQNVSRMTCTTQGGGAGLHSLHAGMR